LEGKLTFPGTPVLAMELVIQCCFVWYSCIRHSCCWRSYIVFVRYTGW